MATQVDLIKKLTQNCSDQLMIMTIILFIQLKFFLRKRKAWSKWGKDYFRQSGFFIFIIYFAIYGQKIASFNSSKLFTKCILTE